MPRIGVDLMGSDASPEALLQAVLGLHQKLKDKVEFVVLGTDFALKSPEEIETVLVSDVITNDDDPLQAIRKKTDSSLCVGVRMLQNKEIDAFVSAGNTGALLAYAKHCLPTLPDIIRPALIALLPTKSKEVAVIDIGANLKPKVEHLVQFAAMGIAYQKTRGIAKPTVGLLNIGAEKKKGTPELQETYDRLQSLNRGDSIFIGNVEGRDVFQGHVDVLVTDGFTGNVFLKTCEGIAGFILDELMKKANEELPPHFKNIFNTLQQRLHYAEYPGAILCGVDGIIVKCHGDSTSRSLVSGIKGAIHLLQHNFLDNIKSQLNSDN